MTEKNKNLEFINTVIEQCIDTVSWKYKTPDRKMLVSHLQGLAKLGIITKDKSKKEIQEQIEGFIKDADVPVGIHKQAKEIFALFVDAYADLSDESIQEKNVGLQNQIDTNTENAKKIQQERGNDISDSSETETPSESMDESYIAKAIERSTSYNNNLNTPKEIRETCKKLKYTSEDLGDGRTKHNLHDHGFITPGSKEYTFADMKSKNGKYTMDELGKSKKYQKFQTETGAKYILKPTEVFAMFGEIATAMGISDTIDADFFKNNNDIDGLGRKLLQMFRNITGLVEGRIPIDISNGGYVEYLFCRSDSCGFSGSDFANYGVAFLSGL